MKELVSVVIPIINPEISPTEERLLHHCLQMLSGFPLIFVTYQDADLSIVREHNEHIDVISFPKRYFESRRHFGKLLLMEDFYTRFNWCDFLLVHELNSWVIKDELYYWCKQGYDFLKAAPLEAARPGLLTSLTGPSDEQKNTLAQGYDHNGLYLCRIERMVSTLKNKNKSAYLYRHEDSLDNADSVFWDVEANRLWPNLRKPTAIVNNHFAKHIDVPGSTIAAKMPFALTGITRDNIHKLPFTGSQGAEQL